VIKNIVKPEWIVDCLKENRLIDHSTYLLHTNKNRAQPQILFQHLEKSEENIQKVEPKDVITMSLEALNAKMKNETLPHPSKSSTSTSLSTEEKRTGTAVDPNFLQDFLNNSRLHHISTLGSGFKFHINDLRKNHNGQFPARQELKNKLQESDRIPKHNEIVMHIDMDCFFVSVSLKNHPHLKGIPVAVTHSKGKNESKGEDFNSYSEIASCSYEARAKGLKNGMFVGAALKLCPELKTIPYDFEEYKKTAFTLYDTIAKYTLDIEAVSCDELYADLKSLLVECQVDFMDFVTMLRQEIFDKTGCTCSVGIGANRLQARMATKNAKPNGQFELLTLNIEDYMKNIKIRELPGVGPSTSHQLNGLQLEHCSQLQNLPVHILQQTFGKKFGETLQMMSRGIDDKPLVFEQVRKSVSVEVNYGIRFNEHSEVSFFLKQVCDELSKRLKEIDKKGKLLTLKIMMRAKDASVETIKFMGHGVVDKISKSATLIAPTDDPVTMHGDVLKLLAALNIAPYELRGIGVQMSKLDEERKDSKLIEMFKKVAAKQQSTPQRETVEPIQPKLEISPKRNTNHSPTKKRGRPKKLSALSKPTKSINEMFSERKNYRKLTKRTIEMIDPEVLAELPPEMVEEILIEYQMPDEIQQQELEAPNTSAESTNIKESSEGNIFYIEHWKMMVKSWIDEESDNLEFYKEKLLNDAPQLVRLNDLDILFIAMRFFHRVIEDKEDDRWSEIYNEMAGEVQTQMLQTFKRKLSIPKGF
jgi:DNA repair protein REV1